MFINTAVVKEQALINLRLDNHFCDIWKRKGSTVKIAANLLVWQLFNIFLVKRILKVR